MLHDSDANLPPLPNLKSSYSEEDAWDPYAEVNASKADVVSQAAKRTTLPPLPSATPARTTTSSILQEPDGSKKVSEENLGVLPVPEPEEVTAILMIDEAENRLPWYLSIFFQTLPYFTLAGLFLTPAWPEPSQVLLGYYSIAYFLGWAVVHSYKNSWLKYNIFLAPLILAALARFAPVIGRILLCQVAATPRNLTYIQGVSNYTVPSAWVDGGCRGYINQNLSQREVGFLVWEVIFLVQLLGMFLQGRNEKKKLLMRIGDYAERLREAKRNDDSGAGLEAKGDEAV